MTLYERKRANENINSCFDYLATISGVVNLGRGGVLEANSAYRFKDGGSATFNFDGGTFKWYGDTTWLSASAVGGLFYPNGNDKAVDVTVSANGGTIDNSGIVVRIPRTITGVGGMTLVGVGTTLISADQSYLGTCGDSPHVRFANPLKTCEFHVCESLENV